MPPSPPRPYRLRHRLVASLVTLVALVFVCGGAALVSAAECRRGMASAHHLDMASRQAAALGRLAREQYLHEAHTMILGDESHVEHHDEWVRRFQAEAEKFRADLPPEASGKVEQIATESRSLAEVFAHEIVPAVARHDHGALVVAHDHADAVVETMTSHADALADALEARATAEEARAERASSRMLAYMAITATVASLFALLVARHLWRGFWAPLARLRDVSARVTDGDRRARVGPLAAEELTGVAGAFDAMLDALAEKETALVAAERLAVVGRIAAGVAHEINNPVTVIRGYARQLLKQERAAALRDEISIIDEEAAVCQRITEDLLAYTRAPALSRQSVGARRLAAEAIEKIGDGLGQETESPAVSTDVEDMVLFVDPVRIRQVLVNLLRNATETGATKVTVTGRSSGDLYEFRVVDNGPGLPPDARLHLFEPFFTTKLDGSGLGLAVSFGLVKAHGGSLRAVEAGGGGLEMVVALPRSSTGIVT